MKFDQQIVFGLYLMTFRAVSAMLNPCMPGINCQLPDAPIKPFRNTDIPQLVLITVDGVLSNETSERLFNDSRRNPDECPISVTTFMRRRNVDIGAAYAQIQRGMDVSLFGDIDISNSTEKEAYDMILEVKTQMASTIPHLQKVLGWRSSNMSLAGRKLFNALSYIGFTYDSSLMVYPPKDGKTFQWPFRLSRGWKLPPCDRNGNCDQGHFPDLLQFPVTALYSYKNNVTCFTISDCTSSFLNENALDLLLANLESVYIGNRAPFVIQIDSNWLQMDPEHIDQVDKFVQRMLLFNDIYMVSIEKAVQWLANPHPVSRLHQFSEWQCPLQAKDEQHIFQKLPQHSDPYKPEEKKTPLQIWNAKTRVEKIRILFAPNGTLRPYVTLTNLCILVMIVITLF